MSPTSSPGRQHDEVLENMRDEDVRIDVWSHPDYEELVAEIYYRDEYVGLLSEETKGIRIFETEQPLKIEARVLTAALDLAFVRLDKLDEPPEG